MKILSQRNPLWADIHLGKSNETNGKKGCLNTCNSAVTGEIDNYHDPKWMAQNLDFTELGLFIWASIIRAKLDFVYRFYKRDDAKIKKAFADPDQFVVMEVNHNHWVWLVGAKNGYRVMDPYYGDVIQITQRKYTITGFAILEKQDEDEWTVDDEANTETSIITGIGIDFMALKSGARFIDLSHWNDIVDLSKAKSFGIKAAIHKCTQGISNKDSAYIVNKQRIRDIELAFGAYHFAEASDYVKEADWFLKNLGEIRTGDILALDYETYIRNDADQWALDWMNHVREKTGLPKKYIKLYAGNGQLIKYKFPRVAAAGYECWGSRYGLQEQNPNKKYMPDLGAFKKFWAWQFCSMGIVPGINKRVDLNIIQ